MGHTLKIVTNCRALDGVLTYEAAIPSGSGSSQIK